MRFISISTFAALLLGLAVPGTKAQALKIGDPAPKIEVKSFLKGEPVKEFEAGKFYVVEFWATWCPPCRVSIPHLTELQKKYPKVTFIGVSVAEHDQDAVKPFVDQMGDKMDYRVALDAVPEGKSSNEGAMSRGWMQAAEQDGIPCAFIVGGDGKIYWIGLPMLMDGPLEKISSGSWDLKTAIAEAKRTRKRKRKRLVRSRCCNRTSTRPSSQAMPKR